MSRWHRFLNAIGRRDLDPEIDEEIQFHIDSRIADNRAAGMSEAEARRDAFARFGSRAATREDTRDTHVFVFLETIWQDTTFAVRSLTRRPVFLLVAISTLALGMGSTTAVFTLVRSVLLRPLPFPDPDRLYVITHAPQGAPFGRFPSMADTDYLAFREADRWFQATATFATAPATLTGVGAPVRLARTTVTPDFFRVLGAAPALGRTFEPGDERSGSDRILVLSDALWRSRFGADPGLVNRSIALDGVEHRVVGILSRGFHFPADTELWTPLAVEASANNTFFRPVIGRLRAEVPEGVAQKSFEALGRLLTGQGGGGAPSVSRLIPLKDAIVGDTSRPLLVFSAAVALVLLISCANVANLLLMRAVSRRQEIATRLALGAAHGRVARQLLTESVMLSVGGGSAGMLLAWAGVPLLLTLMPPGRLPQDIDVRADLVVFACALLVSTATGLVLGVAPALQASGHELSATLREGGGPSRRSHRLRHALVIGEITLAFVLLVGAGLLLRSFANLRSVKTGFDPTNVITMTIELPDTRYPDSRTLAAFHDQLLASLARVPGVVALGAVNWIPLGDMLIRGDFTTERGSGDRATKAAVSPGYFGVMGISLLAGRDFTADDTANAPGVTIVSESVARRTWPGESAIGRRVSLEDNPRPQDWLTVVGVVGDIRQGGVREPAVPAIYQPLGQVTRPFFLSHMTYVARTAANPEGIAPAMRAALSGVDRDQAPLAVATMEQVLMGTIAETRFQTRLLGAFACVAVVLAAIGIYGVLASSVVERTREIGIRLALGAGRGGVVRMVLWRTLLLAIAGVLLGLTGAYATTQILTSFLFNVTATDRATLMAAAGTLIAVALVAGLVPARKASTVDPLTALRTL
jgi:predicted permease